MRNRIVRTVGTALASVAGIAAAITLASSPAQAATPTTSHGHVAVQPSWCRWGCL